MAFPLCPDCEDDPCTCNDIDYDYEDEPNVEDFYDDEWDEALDIEM